jgi:hypothetical protein
MLVVSFMMLKFPLGKLLGMGEMGEGEEVVGGEGG